MAWNLKSARIVGHGEASPANDGTAAPALRLDPGLYRRRVTPKPSSEDRVRLFLIAMACLWLIVGVVLPLFEVIGRATHVELPVRIEDPPESEKPGHDFRGQISIAGRSVLLMMEGTARTIYVDNKKVPVILDRADREGISVALEGETIREVVCRRVKPGSTIRRDLAVEPITVTRGTGQGWTVDGKPLPSGDTVMVIKRYIGLVNFFDYFADPGMTVALWNSIRVAVSSTVIAVFLAFAYALGIHHTRIPGKAFFKVVAMLPLFAPTMLYGLSLVYLFGNKGIITSGFFGRLPFLSLDIGLYGFTGIVIAEIVFTFPPAFMILLVALSNTDARLHEAADSLGAGKVRTFFTVTIPSIKYGLLSAVFVCFTLSFTDFGAPKVVGGQFNILAVDIYKQVIGQQNFGMGATVSIILLVPTLLAFMADRFVQRRAVVAVTARSVPLTPKPGPVRDMVLFTVCTGIAGFILAMMFTAGVASLVKIWPYSFTNPEIYPRTWTLSHYGFHGVGGGGYRAFWNSVSIAALTSVCGTVITFSSAYLIEKTKGMAWLRKGAYFLSIIPLALPGLVIGIAYIFFFNNPRLVIPFTPVGILNPFSALYGTAAILVICNIVHFYTVSFLTATTALRQLDKEFEAVSESMAVPFYTTSLRVSVPVCFPAILEVAAYYFVSAMATVSAVIFLYSSDLPLAAVAVVNMDDAGDTAPAAAMCMLIVLTNIVIRTLMEAGTALFKRKTQAWRQKSA
ncbi:MAG: putative 2-aminoethylphosphonate ABC transporter permease subunit [Pseudomonadota bacterium]